MMLAARASGMIFLSAISVRTVGFNKTQSRIALLPARRARPAADCVRAIRIARRYGIFRGNCLSQSLALLWMLRRAGHDAAIQIGVKPSPSGLLAHAWVELGGETIDPSATAGEYAPLFS